jgi:hypothetical protein
VRCCKWISGKKYFYSDNSASRAILDNSTLIHVARAINDSRNLARYCITQNGLNPLKLVVDIPAQDELVVDKPVLDMLVDSMPAQDELVMDRLALDKLTEDMSVQDELVVDIPAQDELVVDKPALDMLVGSMPAQDELLVGKLALDKLWWTYQPRTSWWWTSQP